MQFFLKNIKNKLKKAVVNDKIQTIAGLRAEKKFLMEKVDSNFLIRKKFSFHVIHSVLFKFLFFFSKKILKIKNKRKNLMILIKLFNYLNFYFFNNNIYFFKKFFIKKNKNLFFLDKFFSNFKYIDVKKESLARIKEKKIFFYKKNV